MRFFMIINPLSNGHLIFYFVCALASLINCLIDIMRLNKLPLHLQFLIIYFLILLRIVKSKDFLIGFVKKGSMRYAIAFCKGPIGILFWNFSKILFELSFDHLLLVAIEVISDSAELWLSRIFPKGGIGINTEALMLYRLWSCRIRLRLYVLIAKLNLEILIFKDAILMMLFGEFD